MTVPLSDPQTLRALLQRCGEACVKAESSVGRLDSKRFHFLTESLGDVVRQLDLILGVLEVEASGKNPRDGRPGLLKRFFHRSQQARNEEEFQAPNFDVSRQGLQGNSWSVPLSELLSFLAFGRKTGVLWVDTPDENFLLGIADGVLMHGSSDRTPEGLRIGEILVRFGYLTRRQLDRFIGGGDGVTAGTTGEALLDNGLITPEELHRALVHQVQQLVNRMVHTDHAIFRFREGFEVAHAYQVKLNINQLLLTSARAQDENVNPEIRSQVVQKDWDSWTQTLSDEISSVAQWAAEFEEGDHLPPTENLLAALNPSMTAKAVEEDLAAELEAAPPLVPSESGASLEEAGETRSEEVSDEDEDENEDEEPHCEPLDPCQDCIDLQVESNEVDEKGNPRGFRTHKHLPHRTHGGRLKSKKRQRRAS